MVLMLKKVLVRMAHAFVQPSSARSDLPGIPEKAFLHSHMLLRTIRFFSHTWGAGLAQPVYRRAGWTRDDTSQRATNAARGTNLRAIPLDNLHENRCLHPLLLVDEANGGCPERSFCTGLPAAVSDVDH